MPDLSDMLIVIPCLNEEAHLPALLDQLCAQSASALIVVVDGGSTDRSRAIVIERMARHHQLRLLDNPARIQSAGINLAVRTHGTGRRWLVRVDAHCHYPDDYAARLKATALAHKVQSVVVPMHTFGTSCFQKAIASAQNSRLGTGGSPHRHVGGGGFVDHGHHALMDLACFRRLGGYDASFTHNEDAEFDHRLARAGGRIWLEPSLALGYVPRATAAGLFRQYFAYGRGRARTIRKHRLRPALRQLAPALLAPALLLLLPLLVWSAMAIGYGLVLALRERSWCAVASGPAAMIMHLAWSLGFWSGWTNRAT